MPTRKNGPKRPAASASASGDAGGCSASVPKRARKARQSKAAAAPVAAVPPADSPAAAPDPAGDEFGHWKLKAAPGVLRTREEYLAQRHELEAELTTRPAQELARRLAHLTVLQQIQSDTEAAYGQSLAEIRGNMALLHDGLARMADLQVKALQQELADAPRAIGAKGGARARFAPVRQFAVDRAMAVLAARASKPSRAALAAQILPEVVAEATRLGRPLRESNGQRTVDGWLKEAIDPALLAGRG